MEEYRKEVLLEQADEGHGKLTVEHFVDPEKQTAPFLFDYSNFNGYSLQLLPLRDFIHLVPLSGKLFYTY